MSIIRMRSFPGGEVRFTMFEPVSRVSVDKTDETGCVEQEVDSGLNLTVAKNSNRHTGDGELSQGLKVGHGLMGRVSQFSLNGRRRIMRAAGAIDEAYPDPADSLFFTGTLPGSTEEAKRAIAEWSSYAINLVQSWLAKRIPKKMMIYAWEFQKRGALHLHLTIACQDRGVQAELISEWKAQWTRVIDGISAKSGVDCWRKSAGFTYAERNKSSLRTDAQVCRKSVGAYLSKYMSKANLSSQYVEQPYSPSRYWGISRPLCELLESLTQELEIEISKPNACQSLYSELLMTAESRANCSYSWRARVGAALGAVSYVDKQERHEIWKELAQKMVVAASSFCTRFLSATEFSGKLHGLMLLAMSEVAHTGPLRVEGESLGMLSRHCAAGVAESASTQSLAARMNYLDSGLTFLRGLRNRGERLNALLRNIETGIEILSRRIEIPGVM